MINDPCEPLSNPLEFEELVERFELAWERATPPPIDRFLADATYAQTGSAFRRDLLLTLVGVDLEHRWRRCLMEGASRSAHDGLPPRPKIEDYVAHIPEMGTVDQVPLEIVVDEFRARHYWGDRPSVDQFVARFPHLQGELQRTLMEVFDEISPALLKVYCEKQVIYSTRFEQPIEIGRQSPSKPPPVHEVNTDEGARLVIAPMEERRLSRRHVHLQRTEPRIVRVTSRTTKGDIGVESTHLSPGEVTEIELPVLLVLGQHVVRVELLK